MGPSQPNRTTVLHVTTIPSSLLFLHGQASFMRRAGFEVHAVSSAGPELTAFARQERATVHAVEMTRRVTPLQDLCALWRLRAVLRRVRPDVVHGHTPKGGLLAMLAGWLAGTPVRVYHLRGLPLLTASGARRRILWATERTSCALAHRVIAVSGSMRSEAIRERLCDPDRITVLLGGSGNGVDAAGRFRPLGEEVRRQARARRGIPPDALVVGFVGRIARDKGVGELARAWANLRDRHPSLHLLLVGEPESNDPLPDGVLSSLRADPRVHLTGHEWDTPPLYAAMDVVALPTYREGFPNVALEAAAMALPLVATSVPGCVDAVRDGVTGILVPPRDPEALAAALDRYLANPPLRAEHGAAGRLRALQEFGQEAIWSALAAEYRALLAPPPARAAAQ
jgi:glycosyltransferase involved in cell wall biosynthesis